jgi:hypothetical protein
MSIPPATHAVLAEVFRRLGTNLVTYPGQRRELAGHGIALADWITEQPAPFAVCLPYDVEHPLMLPGNRLGPCSKCRRVVQWRPDLPAEPKKLCPFCALRRVRGDA